MGIKRTLFVALAFLCLLSSGLKAQKRLRDYGVVLGVMKTGPNNAITDVKGVRVGHVTLNSKDDMRTGVTAIIPIRQNIYENKVPAGVYVGNGFGKMAGISQIQELGNIETPIVLTNTLNVAEGIAGIVENAIIRAIKEAKDGPVAEGCVGAGTGTRAFGYKAGIGTSSRVLPASMGGYTVGVLVQANFGGVLQIAGTPIGQLMDKYSFRNDILHDVDGSCMIVVITDAPVDSRNLERMAKRAILGLAQTGGIAANGSGDYAIALSVAEENLISNKTPRYTSTVLKNEDMSSLFLATMEATSEAIWNSLFAAEDMTGYKGTTVKAIDKEKAVRLILNAQNANGLKSTYPAR